MKRGRFFPLWLACWGILAGLIWPGLTRPVLAQDDTLTITLSRDFGYAGGNGDIQGRFSLRAGGPAGLESVTYFLDGEPMGTVTEPPFRLEFNTDNYPPGRHTITATGFTTAGEVLESNAFTRNFVSAADARSDTVRLMVIIFGGLALVMAAAFIIITLISRNKPPLPMGAPRQYGLYGGAICPKCARPFSMHIYGLNLLTHRFDRCPHCGKWSLVRRAMPEVLAAAERAELAGSDEKPDVFAEDPEEKRRRDLEDSRYQDL